MNRTTYVLARELTDLPEHIRRAPAPVLPEFAAPFTLRPVDVGSRDPETITEWMHRPHLLETWEQAWDADRRRADCTAQLAGTFSRPCILEYDFAALDRPDLGNREVAYVELYRPAKDEIARLYDADARDMGFHIATADTTLLGRGVMSGWMRLLGQAILAAEPECRRLLCEPDHRNTPMRKALEKIGWQHLGDFDIRPDRRIALYALPRSAADLPEIR
ncbi:GNAT family N-acetyltransferase [Nocardia sp. NPDC059228]|uniref:GNAT family N-acetyltransferase n=1 Tax=Nocardia sp. NPDC059228 TaxID=3346777 RepID=UPI00368F2C08